LLRCVCSVHPQTVSRPPGSVDGGEPTPTINAQTSRTSRAHTGIEAARRDMSFSHTPIRLDQVHTLLVGLHDYLVRVRDSPPRSGPGGAEDEGTATAAPAPAAAASGPAATRALRASRRSEEWRRDRMREAAHAREVRWQRHMGAQRFFIRGLRASRVSPSSTRARYSERTAFPPSSTRAR